jgi:hypothetical protein
MSENPLYGGSTSSKRKSRQQLQREINNWVLSLEQTAKEFANLTIAGINRTPSEASFLANPKQKRIDQVKPAIEALRQLDPKHSLVDKFDNADSIKTFLLAPHWGNAEPQ